VSGRGQGRGLGSDSQQIMVIMVIPEPVDFPLPTCGERARVRGLGSDSQLSYLKRRTTFMNRSVKGIYRTV